MTTTHRIAVIPGDGIGREVVPAACRVLERCGERHGFTLQWREFGVLVALTIALSGLSLWRIRRSPA